MKDLFKGLITDFLERPLPKIVSRNYKIPTDTEKIISLIGVRRSGKTFIFYDIIQNLRKSADPANMVYINFEDDRLFNIEIQDLDNLIQAYYELYPAKRNVGDFNMAIDGVKILDSDMAYDIYNEFMDLYDANVKIDEIKNKISQWRNACSDALDLEIFLTVYAQSLWEIGELDKNLIDEIEEIVNNEADLLLWKEENTFNQPIDKIP
jgi:hypothetical protein